MSEKPLKELIEKTREHYDSIGRVKCKILNSDVHFGSEGRRHLVYRRGKSRKKRPVKEQRYKCNLFPLVVPVLKNSTNIQDWRFAGEPSDSDVQHYALVHTVGRQKIKVRVIVKRTGDGQFNYHSVMIHTDKNKKPREKRGS